MNRKLPIAVVVAIIVAGGAVWFTMGSRAQTAAPVASETPAPPTAVGSDTLRFHSGARQLQMIKAEAIPATAVPLTDNLSARVAYDEDATARIGVGVSGRITSVKASIGDTVKAGQVLAELDSPDFGTAISDLNKAKADEDRKRLSLDRARQLVPGEAIPLKDFEAIQADLAQAQAETARATQRLKNLNPRGSVVSGQTVRLISPINGIVADRAVTNALEVAPGQGSPLFTVTDPRKLWLLIDLPERLLGKIKKGSTVDVETDAFPGEHFKATILQTGQAVDPNTRRVTLRARIANPDLKLLPEMFVRARVLQESGNGVRVPNGAIVNSGIYNYVFVETEAGEYQRRRVTLTTQGSESSYVGQGLTGGERVVVTGAMLLDAELSARAGEKS